MRNLKQCLATPAWLDNVVLECLAPQMHMRKEAEQQRVIWKSTVNFDTMIGIAGRNQKVIIGQL